MISLEKSFDDNVLTTKVDWLINWARLSSICTFGCAEHRELRQQVRVRHAVEPGTRTHFTFTLETFQKAGDYTLQLFLMSPSDGGIADDATEVLASTLSVTDGPFVPVVQCWQKCYSKAKEFTLRQIRLRFPTTR